LARVGRTVVWLAHLALGLAALHAAGACAAPGLRDNGAALQ